MFNKTRLFFFLFLIFIFLLINNCTTKHPLDKDSYKIAKNIYIDTTLQSDQPIFIKENIWIANKATLKIKEGTTLILNKDIYITCDGKIEAIGTKEKPIYFISNDENSFWQQIELRSPTLTSEFKNVVFKNSKVALLITDTKVNIEDSTFENNEIAIYIKDSFVNIKNNIFSNNQYAILSIHNNKKSLIEDNMFKNSLKAALYIIEETDSTISKNLFIKNYYSLILNFENTNKLNLNISKNDFLMANNKHIIIDKNQQNVKLFIKNNYFDSIPKQQNIIIEKPYLKNPINPEKINQY